MDSFDKKYIEDMFEEGLKGDVFNGNKINLNYQYEYKEHIYTLNRVRKPDPKTPSFDINKINALLEENKNIYRGNM